MYAEAAELYDLIQDGRGRDASVEAAVVLGEVRRRRPALRSLLDAACGTGAHLPHFEAAGLEVTGVDLSPSMLAVAAARAPQATLVEADLRTLDLGRCFDVVVSLFSGIGYLTEEADLGRAVGALASHLEPGGVLLVEGWVEPEYWIGSGASAEAARRGDLAVARAVASSRQGMICELDMRYVVSEGGALRTIDEHHRMRLADAGEVERAYRSAGLTFERLPHMLHAGRSVYLGVLP